MYFTVTQKLQLLRDTADLVSDGTIQFDEHKTHLGFRYLKQLFTVSQDEIKGYPCIAFNTLSDAIKFGIKVIPLENKYKIDQHPSTIEIALLALFQDLIFTYQTPHITCYFADRLVSNRAHAMTVFPIKTQRRHIWKQCIFLVSEYVPGGSIEEFVQTQPNLSDEQWKYILFSMAWTLHVLQSKYQFMHNDFHYGNILIDTTIDPTNKKYLRYHLTHGDGTTTTYAIQNVGVMAKIWDLEFANAKDHPNAFIRVDEEDVPHTFNPYYDIHYFFTSLLVDLRLPLTIQEFIRSVYPKDVIPVKGWKGKHTSRHTRSRHHHHRHHHHQPIYSLQPCPCPHYPTHHIGTAHGIPSGSSEPSEPSEYSDNSHLSVTEEYYHTNEITYTSTRIDDQEESDQESNLSDVNELNHSIPDGGAHTNGSTTNNNRVNSEENSQTHTLTSGDNNETETIESVYYREDRVRTKYLLGDRLLNGAERKLKLPTPLEILQHPFFAEYTKRVPDAWIECTFSFNEGEAAPSPCR